VLRKVIRRIPEEAGIGGVAAQTLVNPQVTAGSVVPLLAI